MKEEPVLEELIDLLMEAGVEETDAECLLARFLEENAYNYVECMKLMKKGIPVKASLS